MMFVLGWLFVVVGAGLSLVTKTVATIRPFHDFSGIMVTFGIIILVVTFITTKIQVRPRLP